MAQSFDSSLSSSTELNDLKPYSKEAENIEIRRLSSHHSKTSDLGVLPDTENKKRPPDKIHSVDPSVFRRAVSRDLDTPVTIDILSDYSGRVSRQSILDPIPYRDFISRYSNVRVNIIIELVHGKFFDQ